MDFIIEVMPRGYAVLVYYISPLRSVPLSRYYTYTVVLITDTVLLLVIMFMNDRFRVPTEILL